MPDPRQWPGAADGLMGTLDGAMAVETSGNGGCPVVDVDRNCKRNNDKSDDKPTGYKRHVTYLLQPVAHV